MPYATDTDLNRWLSLSVFKHRLFWFLPLCFGYDYILGTHYRIYVCLFFLLLLFAPSERGMANIIICCMLKLKQDHLSLTHSFPLHIPASTGYPFFFVLSLTSFKFHHHKESPFLRINVKTVPMLNRVYMCGGAFVCVSMRLLCCSRVPIC